MSFSTAFDGKVIYLPLFSELTDKPILRKACLDVIGSIVRGMVESESKQCEGESGDDIDKSRFEDLLTEMADDYTCEDDEAERITMEYGMENAVELYDECGCESLEEVVEEHGHRNGILAYHIIKQQFEREVGDDLLCDLVRYALRFVEGDEYTELSFQYVRY